MPFKILATWVFLNGGNGIRSYIFGSSKGIRRFDAANRFFLVLVDKDNLEESWKLKRNKVLLVDKINTYLEASDPQNIDELKIEFHWQNEVYATYTDILFIAVG